MAPAGNWDASLEWVVVWLMGGYLFAPNDKFFEKNGITFFSTRT
jgi:hypothetical protein